MKKLLGAVAVGAALGLGSLTGAGTANASPAVCDGIDEAPSYSAYLINAWVWGKAFNASPRAQAATIVSSVLVYCPWHAAGIRAAAASMDGDSTTW